MKKYIICICIITVLCTLILGCTKEPAISDDVEAVLKATCNSPNAELHDPACRTSLDMSEEEKAAAEQRFEELNKNWEELLGEYFSPGSFDLFLNSYLRGWFLYDDPIPSELVSMTLVSIDETREVVDVQVDVDGSIVELTVTFRRNPDGLIYRVDALPKN